MPFLGFYSKKTPNWFSKDVAHLIWSLLDACALGLMHVTTGQLMDGSPPIMTQMMSCYTDRCHQIKQLVKICTKTKQNKDQRKCIRWQPWQLRLIYCARIISGKSKPKCTIPLTVGFCNPYVDTFTNAHRPTTEANTFDTFESFSTATIVWQANVNAVCCMKEYWPTVQRCNAQLIYTIIACNGTQCNVTLQ